MHQRLLPRRLIAALALSCTMLAPALTGGIPTAGATARAVAATPANTAYVRALYKDLLDRTDETSDAEGVAYWANQLPGRSRADVARAIQYGSSEYFGVLVDIAYASYLDRVADPAGRAYYVDGWRSRRLTYEGLLAALLGSNEYYGLHGATNASFVDAVYFDVLGREADPGGRAHYQGVASTQGRGAVAVLLATSHEARVAQVSFQYLTFLGRPADPGGLAYWVDQLSNGLRREDFDVALLSSSEYYNNNT